MWFDQTQNKSALVGKVLRINRDGTIPPDNPFPHSPVFSLGHRNIYGIAFDDKGLGIVTENGEAHHDEINVIRKGANYGFPTTQGPSRSPMEDNSGNLKPIRDYYQTTAPAQALYYDGNKFPSLKGKYLIAMYNTGGLHAIALNTTGKIQEEMTIKFPSIYDNMIAIAQSPTGDIYFGADNIYKLESVDKNTPFTQIKWIDTTLNGAVLGNMHFDPIYKTLFMDVTTSSNDPFISVKLPKSLLAGIFDVKSSLNQTADQGTLVKQFKISQQSRTAHGGDTTILMELNPNSKGQISVLGTHTDLANDTSIS